MKKLVIKKLSWSDKQIIKNRVNKLKVWASDEEVCEAALKGMKNKLSKGTITKVKKHAIACHRKNQNLCRAFQL